ncbi:MAG: alpha-(1-_3)-arabinofuranosyltransferase [Candidatus Nanopelagicales bacterium]|nr:alpha-(1->3)-arabinofuranosyltransferase [Candidatus Nanopelagicales bacterium]
MTRTTYRFRLATVCLGLVALAFLQEPGRVAADTKLDLTQDPWGFLGRALQMWDPSAFFGQLQNQAYGYLWPVGPLFALLDTLQVPPWAAQRVWWALILVVGFLGFVRMSRLLGVESGLARVVAGLAYVLSIRVLTELTTVSVEAWPMVLAPWMLVALILGAARGSPRRWAGVAALVFGLTGAINAVLSVAILPLGVLYLITRSGGPRRRALAGWWIVGLGLTSLWWLIPLLLLGRYSPPFLDWIEGAATTTSQTDPTSVLRGASHWVPYLLDAEGPVWPAGWELVSNPVVVAATAAVALLGLTGLLLERAPERAFLVITLCTGMTLVGMGHVSDAGLGGLGAPALRELLDQGLAPLRNVHKFQPLVTLPLAMGVAALVDHARRRAREASRPAAGVHQLAVGVAVTAVTVAALPALTGALVGGRSYLEIPGYWAEAAEWLNAQDEGRALVVPAASFGVFLWGRTQDEPLQPLGTASWGVRDAVPLSSAGNIRLLDEVERRIGSGTGSAGLARALGRAGVRWLVVRNDLNLRATRAALPVVVHQALESSPGITRAASFGPVLLPFTASERIVDGGLLRGYPAVEVYRVAPDPQVVAGRVALRDAGAVTTFTGAAEALPDLLDSGLLGSGAAIAAGDPLPEGARPSSVVTDTFRRAEANFGAARRQYSNTLTAEDPFQSSRAVHDYHPVEPSGRLSVARLEGAAAVSASSSASSPFTLRVRSPAAQPWAALDGDPGTAWVSGDFARGVGQWWEVDFDVPITTDAVTVRFVVDRRVGRPPAVVRVTTDLGWRDVPIEPGIEQHTLPLPGSGAITRLRLELMEVEGGGRGQGFGLAEVQIPGVTVTRPVLTAPEAGDGGLVLAARSMGRESCVPSVGVILCNPDLVDPSEERAAIDRVVDVGAGGEYRVVTRLRPRPGLALDAFLAAPENAISVEASSVAVPDPAGRAQAAADQNTRTTWIASPVDREPTLTLRLPEVQRITGVVLQTSVDAPASRPLQVTVEVGDLRLPLFTDALGELTFPPVESDVVRLRFGTVNPVRSVDSATGASTLLPVGVTEAVVIGGEDRRMLQYESSPVPVPCGFGPRVLVDGVRAVDTRVDASVGGILEGALAPGDSCGQALRLSPGTHRIRVEATAEWTVERVYLIPSEAAAADPASPAGPDLPQVVSWGDAARSVAVPAATSPRLLETTENFNAGWRATLGSAELVPLRVDGWRQAFLVPAGAAGVVELAYAPNRTYQVGLLAGLAAVLLLLLLTAWPPRAPAPPPVGAAGLRRTLVAVPLAASVLVGGVAGALGAAAVVGLASTAAARSSRATALRVARGLGLLGAGISLASQALWTWPARVDAGFAYQVLLIVGPALALGALASVAILHRHAPSPGSAAPAGTS